MYRARSKRAERWRLILTYTLAPLLIVTIVTLLVMYMLGYRFSLDDHRVSQGGLVQLATQPGGAEVTVDTYTLPGRTATRYDAAAGLHTVTMRRDGYESWQKTVTVEPGKVLWLNYARLIPQKIKQTTVETYTGISSSAGSGQTLVLVPDAAKPTLQVVTLGDTTRQTAVMLPATLSGEVTTATRFAVTQLSKSGRYALVKATTGKQHEWLYVDTQAPDRSRNVTTIVGEATDEPMFVADNDRQLYVVANHELRLVDIGKQTVSAPIISNIAEVQQSRQGVLSYTTLVGGTPRQRVVGYYTPGAAKPQVLRTYYDDGRTVLRLRIAEYAGDQYVALQYGTSIEISSTHLSSSDNGQELSLTSLATLAVPDGAEYVSFSPKGRFVISQHASTYVTYDVELNSLSTTSLKGDSKVVRQLVWLDDHIVWSDRDSVLRLYEFDGANAHTIGSVIQGQAALLSSDGKYIYAFQPGVDGTGVSLVRFHLRVES